MKIELLRKLMLLSKFVLNISKVGDTAGSEQPAPVLSHPHRREAKKKKVFPDVQIETSVF